MRIVFLSNYYTHHQSPFCEELYKLTNGSFAFVSTETFDEERKKLGWNCECEPDFVLHLNDDTKKTVEEIVNNADFVILGSAPIDLVTERLKHKKIVFKYSERVFKDKYDFKKWLPRLVTYYKRYGRFKSLYLLSASAYTSLDFAIHGTFLNKSYKFGYFPETKDYNVKKLLDNKDNQKIIWCGRFVDWKHPELAIELAKRLKKEGLDFSVEMFGFGELESFVRSSVEENGLSDCVKVYGSVTPEQIRANMETSGIHIFTSDFHEGWGAVLNESMNSGCAVVASHAIGAVPFLLEHGKNGFVYKNGDFEDFYSKVKKLLCDKELQRTFGNNAYNTIKNLWNAETAASRFLRLAEILNGQVGCELFENGPCSRAKIIKNYWFNEENE